MVSFQPVWLLGWMNDVNIGHYRMRCHADEAPVAIADRIDLNNVTRLL